MHPLWTIPEIVSVICASLSRSDCTRLTRVHSIIWGSVIHLIWAKVPGISCLYGLFPDLDFSKHEVLDEQVFLNEQQWTRFDIHSKLIKELKVEVEDRRVLDPLAILKKAWAQRPSASSRTFIPTIKHLNVLLPDLGRTWTSTDEWATLFSDTLLSFNYTFRLVAGRDQVDATLVPCLEALRATSPHLQSLTLRFFGFQPMTEVVNQAVVETIRALDKLDSLGLDVYPYIQTQVVHEALSTGRLSRLYMGDVKTTVHPVESATALVSQHSITDVGLSGTSAAMKSFINYMDPSQVRRLVAKDSDLRSWGAYEGGGTGFWELLSQFTNLDQLELDLDISSFNTLLPLQNQLQRLVSFSVGPSILSTPWISYRTLPQLAALLPRIEEFQIIGDRMRLSENKVPLDTLQCFATSCPHLRKLRIPICLESSTVTGLQSHPSIQEIDLRGSEISYRLDLDAAAKTIAAMFPKLLSFVCVSHGGRHSDLAEALARVLPGLILSGSDDDGRALGFRDFFSRPLRIR